MDGHAVRRYTGHGAAVVAAWKKEHPKMPTPRISRGGRFRAMCCCGVILTLCCTIWPAGRQVVAATTLTRAYSSGQYRYGIEYPRSWKPLRVPGANFAIIAPDRNVVVAITTMPGVANLPTLARGLRLAFAPFGRLVGPPVTGVVHPPGATGLLATASVITPSAQRSDVLALAASHHQHMFIMLGVVQNGQAGTALSDVAAARAILASARFL